MESILEKRRAEVMAEIDYGKEQFSRIEFILSNKDTIMNYQATIKEIPEAIVYSTSTTVESFMDYFQLIPAIGQKVMGKYPELKCTSPEYCFIKYLDGEYRDKNISIEFCEEVDQLKENFDDIVFKKIEGATVVSTLHKGPYSTIAQAYTFLMKWIDESNYTMADVSRESHIDGIWNKKSEEDWLTEVQIPITRK